MIEKLTKTRKDKTERRNNKKQTFHNAANQEEKTRERTLLNGRNNCKVKGVVFLQVGTSLQGTVAVCGCYWSSLFNGLFSSVIVISLCEMMARSIEFLRQCIVCPLSDYPPLIMASRWWRSVVSKHVDVSSVALLCSTVTLQGFFFSQKSKLDDQVSHGGRRQQARNVFVSQYLIMSTFYFSL